MMRMVRETMPQEPARANVDVLRERNGRYSEILIELQSEKIKQKEKISVFIINNSKKRNSEESDLVSGMNHRFTNQFCCNTTSLSS